MVSRACSKEYLVGDASFEKIIERSPMASGPTGALFERVRLVDGSRCVVKHLSPANDVIMRTLGDRGSIKSLWDSGFFSRLPAPIVSSVVGIQEETDGWAVLMPDLSEHLIDSDHILSHADSTRILTALDGMHRTFEGERIPGLCSHRDKLELDSPRMVQAEQWADGSGPPERGRDGKEWPFTRAVVHGWELFNQMAGPEVVSAIASLHHDPDPLAGEMDRLDSTIIHGDLQFSNMALMGDAIYLLDWGSATIHGTPEEDFVWYLMANQPQIEASHDQLMAEFISLRGSRYVPEALDLATIFIVTLMGCWLAWAVVEEPDEKNREVAAMGFEWWMRRTIDALGTWAPS